MSKCKESARKSENEFGLAVRTRNRAPKSSGLAALKRDARVEIEPSKLCSRCQENKVIFRLRCVLVFFEWMNIRFDSFRKVFFSVELVKQKWFTSIMTLLFEQNRKLFGEIEMHKSGAWNDYRPLSPLHAAKPIHFRFLM